jgi:DNA-directed RNA polymerase III subunit RPC8
MLDSQVTERMYIDAAEIVRVRVESDEFYDHEPGPPPKALEGVRVAREQKKAPYTITVSLTYGAWISFLWVGVTGCFFW